MARKSKIETQKQVDGQGSEPTAGSAAGSDLKTTGAAPKPQKKKAAPKKKRSRTIKPAASQKKPAPAPSLCEPSDEEIRIRAYFIAERRIQLSLAGDSAHDWVEARRQLIEEAGPASS